MRLKEGDLIPEFELKNQDGELIQIKNFFGKPLVIYFYPKDDTPGCTKQACSFRDSFEDFLDLGCTVIGISSDSVQDHKEFKEKHRLPFTLLSDEKGEVRKQFGVPTNLLGLIPGRVTYVINKDAQLIKIFNSQTKFDKHIKESISAIKGLSE